ncbi:heme-binding domain-containing protein [Escherichia coli]|uniref:heme-binding domain-containing protein n=1 Tax=Escherichia coli TaxID=562 RepID=UPI00049F859F|nr:heme-binding domain-containing protein [Escherichia coli]KDG69491.1 hypothetical protein AE10_03647 [Escherichia coli UCI 51]
MKMVSRITAIGLAGVAICYLGLSGYVWYHDNKRSKQADVQASAVSENNKVLGFLREKGCDYCHTPSAELPAYYYIPGAKQLMDYDIKLGYKSFNLEAVRAALLANKPVSQSDLNKIEGTVAKLAMRQPFVLFKGLTFQKLCLPGAFRPGDHHNKMLRPGLCVVHASPQYL